MAFNYRRQVERHHRIRARQPSSAWSKDYEPAIRATREEAPSSSQATILSELNKLGRELHACSIPERHALVILLFCPEVVWIGEQFALQPFPSPHPLKGFAGAEIAAQKELPGSTHVFKHLGALDQHPVIYLPHKSGQFKLAYPDYLVADAVYAVQDPEGVFALALDVKKSAEGFHVPFGDSTASRSPSKVEKHRLRIEGSTLYFKAAAMDTRRFHDGMYSQLLYRNLEFLFYAQARAREIPEEVQQKIELLVTASPLDVVSGLKLSDYARVNLGVSRDDFHDVFYALIWDRRIRVDLEVPLLFDRPLRLVNEDPKDRFRQFVQRTST